MKEKNFLTYMNLLDDTYIEEAEIGAPVVRTARQGKVLRRIPALVAATVTLMALLVVSAFATFDHWSSYLSLVFRGDVELLDDYTVAAKDVKYTSTNEDVKMEIVGYTGDENYAYVWVKMTLPEEFVDQLDMENVDGLMFSLQAQNLFWNDKFIGGIPNKNTYVFGLEYRAQDKTEGNLEDSFSLFGSTLEVAIKELRIWMLDGSSKTLPGEWSGTFTYDMPDLSKKFSPSVKNLVLYSDNPEKSEKYMEEMHPSDCKVAISPMSVRLTVKCNDPDNLLFDGPGTLTVVFSDGTTREGYMLRSIGSQPIEPADFLPETWIFTALFKEPFNPDDVVAIEYAGARIELK